MRALIGQKHIVYCTGKHMVSDTQHYVRTRGLRTLAKTYVSNRFSAFTPRDILHIINNTNIF